MKDFIPISPEKFINMPIDYVFLKLKKLIGKEEFEKVLNINSLYKSPFSQEKNSKWLQNTKIIGINPRIAGNYFNILKYAMTFPENAVHIMPVWEMGCDDGLYSRINWKLSTKWLSKELIEIGYDTPEKQLKLVINGLHSLKKAVGFDIIPHTDKFSEEVFLIPDCFEWIKLNKEKTQEIKFNDSEEVYPLIKNKIISFLKENNCANGETFKIENFFEEDFTIEKREEILFGHDFQTRQKRRIDLINYVRKDGFETHPVTEHAPRRPILFDCIKYDGEYDYATFSVLNKPKSAKIFNSITPYRWYKLDSEGYIIQNKRIEKTFDYFINNVIQIQKEFNIDFIRADMGHNQAAHSDKKEEKDTDFKLELWRELKEKVQTKNNVPYFATFAEAFLGDYYIDGIKDTLNKNFDVILGITNFFFLNAEFINLISYYLKLKEKYPFSPCISSITNDSDRIENNNFYQSPMVCELRYFIQTFFSLTGYMGMGFEVRNNIPKSKYEYSAHYTNYQDHDYIWGKNKKLFKTITKLRKIYSKIKNENLKTRILSANSNEVLVWILYDEIKKVPKYLCVVNLDIDYDKKNVIFDTGEYDCFDHKKLIPIFSMEKPVFMMKTIKASTGKINNVGFADAQIYKFAEDKKNLKNPNQILIVTPELIPYAKTGGLADYCKELVEAYKKVYKNADIRFIMPLYNAENASFDKNNSYIEIFGEKNGDEPKRFKIKDTKIKTNFEYGVFNSSAKLYKTDTKDKHIYFVHSNIFSSLKKEYAGNTNEFAFAFGASIAALLKPLNKYEKFNPYLIITNDHLCVNTINSINCYKRYDKFYEGIKTLHIVHNPLYLGEQDIINGFCSSYNKKFIKDLVDNSFLGNLINVLSKKYKKKDVFETLKFLMNGNFNDDEDYLKLIQGIKCIYKNSIYDNQYNFTKRALFASTKWLTVSTFMYELLTEKNFFTKSFSDNKLKGCGILSGIKEEEYSPSDKKYIEFPYGDKNILEGKIQNKLFIQKMLSKENLIKGNVSLELVKNIDTKAIGYLNEDKNKLLLLYASRAYGSKGFPIIQEIMFDMLEKYDNIQFILAGDGVIKEADWIGYPDINKYLLQGRFVAINGYIHIRKFFAASDIFVMPSILETCGLSIMQGLRYGCVPVIFNTGCARDIINSKNGCVCHKSHFMDDFESLKKNYSEILYRLIEKFSDENEKIKMQKSAMNTNVGWTIKTINKYHSLFNSMKG